MLDKIERDLKAALLAREKETVDTLKGVKTALQYEAVSKNMKINDLSDEQIQTVLAREAKKRQDAIDLYRSVGEEERAMKETQEKEIIQSYLPAQLSEEEVAAIVKGEIAKLEAPTPGDMGKVIGAVKGRTAQSADGSTIARLTKQFLEQASK
jgi:hypothetical protein